MTRNVDVGNIVQLPSYLGGGTGKVTMTDRGVMTSTGEPTGTSTPAYFRGHVLAGVEIKHGGHKHGILVPINDLELGDDACNFQEVSSHADERIRHLASTPDADLSPSRQPTVKLQLVVYYLNGQTRYYPISKQDGWRIDTLHRCIVVGNDIPRTHIPLDTVASFGLEEYTSNGL